MVLNRIARINNQGSISIDRLPGLNKPTIKASRDSSKRSKFITGIAPTLLFSYSCLLAIIATSLPIKNEI